MYVLQIMLPLELKKEDKTGHTLGLYAGLKS